MRCSDLRQHRHNRDDDALETVEARLVRAVVDRMVTKLEPKRFIETRLTFVSATLMAEWSMPGPLCQAPVRYCKSSSG